MPTQYALHEIVQAGIELGLNFSYRESALIQNVAQLNYKRAERTILATHYH